MYLSYLFSVYSVFIISVGSEDVTPPSVYQSSSNEELQNITKTAEKKMSEKILELLEHYKKPDPVGLPGSPIPDPMSVPDIKQSFSVGTLNCEDQRMHGLKHFRIRHILVDIKAMKVESTIDIKRIIIEGNYTFTSWFSRSKGSFTVQLQNVKITAIARLDVDRSGQLEAQDIDMDISLENIAMKFQGVGSLVQSIINSAGTVIFKSVKPFMMAEANRVFRTDINKEVKKLPMKFPNSISPFDGLIIDVRNKVRNIGLDPYKVPDYNNTVSVFEVYLTNTWLYGISSFHRTKDIVIEVGNRTVRFNIEIGTGALKGTSNWDISLVAGIMSKYGTVAFSVEYIKVKLNASQSMDTSKSPSIDDIQLELGNIQIRFDGLGTMDYLIEFGINVLPNLLRYQIMDAIEKPIKLKVQEALNEFNIEDLLKENADKLDNMKSLDEFNIEFLTKS